MPDFQRQRVYDAENAAMAEVGRTRLPTVAACQLYVDQVLADPRVRARYHAAPITVTDGRRRRTANADWQARRIKLPVAYRCQQIVLHEMAHIFTPRQQHGRAFVSTYLQLAAWFLFPAGAAALLAHLLEKRVRLAYLPEEYGGRPTVTMLYPEEAGCTAPAS